MTLPSCSDEEFISLFRENGPAGTARLLNIDLRNVYQRRRNLERTHAILIDGPRTITPSVCEYPKRIPFKIDNGTIVIGSDAHYWPGIISTAHRGLVHVCKETEDLKAVILDGDVHDGARTSRHPSLGWEQRPTVLDELKAVEERLDEIKSASRNAKRFWLLGNHCMRFDARLANNSPEYGGIHGMTLKDHFPH